MTREEQRLIERSRRARRAARLLLQAEDVEAAVNRGYYAMFYAACALLARAGRRFSKHSAVQAAFGETFAKTGALDPKYHRWLIDAFDLRAVGDYDVEATLTADDVVTLLEHADEFAQAAERWLESPTT